MNEWMIDFTDIFCGHHRSDNVSGLTCGLPGYPIRLSVLIYEMKIIME